MALRQFPAACVLSASVSANWTSFSASLKVVVETAGPTEGAVPKAGGAPGGSSLEGVSPDGFLLHAAVTPIRPSEAFRNFLRDLDMAHIVAGT
jgi:hypothetical protein